MSSHNLKGVVVPHKSHKLRMMYSAKKAMSIELLSRVLVLDYEAEGADYLRELYQLGYIYSPGYNIGSLAFGLDEEGYRTAVALAIIELEGGGLVEVAEVAWIEVTEKIDTGDGLIEPGTVLMALHEVNNMGREYCLVDNTQLPHGRRHQLTFLGSDEFKILEVVGNEFNLNEI